MDKRIGPDGKFLKDHGLTVIAKVIWPKAVLIEAFFRSSPLLKKYFTPTPYTSYHVTIHPLFSMSSISPREDIGSFRSETTFLDFFNGVESNLQSEKVDLSYLNFTPSFKTVSLYNDRYVGLALSMNSEDEEIARLIVKRMNKIRNRGYHTDFHITLAYQYCPIEPRDRVEVSTELEELRRLISQYIPLTFTCDTAKICRFSDMTKFTEW